MFKNISKYTDTPEKNYFHSFSNLFGQYDKGSFDIIIMCNVLHEIPPAEWLKLFSSSGDIANALSDKGILLIVEDQVMPIGEKAYEKGFLVLDTTELKDLFKITENDKEFGFSDAREDGRLKAHRVKKEYFTRIDAESRKKALESVHRKSSENILDIRSKDIDYKNGKIHGFWVQQYANSGLALDELK